MRARIGWSWLLAVTLFSSSCNCGPTTSSPAGTWRYRYSCGNATQCFDDDVCGAETLAGDASLADRYANSAGTMSGTLEGLVFRWKAHWGTPAYDEVGVWTFSPDFSSFTQVSCYTYDGLADETTTSCTGQNRGECRGAGAKTNPAPPAAVGGCAAGTGSKSCL